MGFRRATNLKTRFQVRKPGLLDKTPKNLVPWELPALKQVLEAPVRVKEFRVARLQRFCFFGCPMFVLFPGFRVSSA